MLLGTHLEYDLETVTMKLRRLQVTDHYKEQIDNMFNT